MAGDFIAFDIRGSKQLARAFKALPAQVQQRSVRKAVSFALTPLLRSVKAEAPENTGALKESMRKKTKVYKGKGVVMGMVGPDKSFIRYYRGQKQVPANYIQPLTYGHIIRNTKGGPVIGTVRPNRFMMRAHRKAQPAMKQRFISKLKKEWPKDLQRFATTGK